MGCRGQVALQVPVVRAGCYPGCVRVLQLEGDGDAPCQVEGPAGTCHG